MAHPLSTLSPIRRLKQVTELPWWAPNPIRTWWEAARKDEALAPEDEALALALLDHPDLSLVWEYDDQLPSGFMIGSENPRVHLHLHQAIENQLIQGLPADLAPALEHLMHMGIGRHRALHLVLTRLFEAAPVGKTLAELSTERQYIDSLKTLQRARSASSQEAPQKKSGRNNPCPCGSGQKYKRCCGDLGLGPVIGEAEGKMMPEYSFYMSFGKLMTLPDDHPAFTLESLSELARHFEHARVPAAAAAAHRRLVSLCDEQLPGAVHNALQDQLMFTMNNPEFLGDGITAANRLCAIDPKHESTSLPTSMSVGVSFTRRWNSMPRCSLSTRAMPGPTSVGLAS